MFRGPSRDTAGSGGVRVETAVTPQVIADGDDDHHDSATRNGGHVDLRAQAVTVRAESLFQGYRWVESVEAPGAGKSGHDDVVRITDLLFGCWMRYLVPGLGLDRARVFRADGRPIVRSINVDVDTAIFPGQGLECGVRALMRRQRSFTLEQLLVSDRRTVARGHVVVVTIDERSGRSVAIPDDVWAAVERLEGRPIGIAADRS